MNIRKKLQPVLSPRWMFVMVLTLGLANPGLPADSIHEAARSGDLEAVKSLIDGNPGLVNLKDESGRTPLHWACRGVHSEIVKFLLDKGADVNARDASEVVPLHSLAARNHSEAMELLLAAGAELDVQDHGGNSALHHAAMNDGDKAAEILVRKGASIELRDNYSRTPLLLCARERGGPKTAAILLAGGADANARDRFGASPLDLAAWRGKKEVVDLLLDAGAEIIPKGRNARNLLSEAASRGLTRLFGAVIEAGADPTFRLSSGGTLMHSAAAGGSVGILEILAAKGLDSDEKDRYGWTPLHYAARDGREAAVEWLLEQGVDMNTRTLMGQSPFNIAEERTFDKIASLLKVKGADAGPIRFPELRGEYMGQKPPSDNPELFAPGIVSSIWGLHSSTAFSPDGDTALWAPMIEIPGKVYSEGGIMMSERTNGLWTAPAWAPFSDSSDGDVPFFSPDGTRVYFISTRQIPGRPGAERIWYIDRTKNGWSQARPVDQSVNDYPHHWQFSVDNEHTLYFSSDIPGGRGGGDIYAARYTAGKWQKPEPLSPAINSEKSEGMPYIAPDGSYLLFSREFDLFISFLDSQGRWGEARSLAPPINSPSIDICPIVSPDGKYMFFLSQRGGENHVWWVDAGFIERLRRESERHP